MKQSLSLNLKQKLLMTPKLQQSINILQLSAHELSELIEKEYTENPVLEMDAPTENSDDSGFDRTAEFLDYLTKDDERPEPAAADDDYKVKEYSQSIQTLAEFLQEQLSFQFKDEKQLQIAAYITDLLDENGYLRTDLDEISVLCKASPRQIENVLKKIQLLEPAGVAARSLEECLALQAKRANVYKGLVKAVIDKHLLQVAKGKIRDIAQSENAEPSEVQAAVDAIRRFNPKPGAPFGGGSPEYIVPDVAVRDINGKLEVILNDSTMPRLHISKLYHQHRQLDSDCRKYIEQHVSSALWLIRSIEQRRLTLLKVVNEIVRQQEDVFRLGLSHMKPLLMKTIAENIGMHESTVSRTVANKYMEMPFGIIALKKFFAGSVSKAAEKSGEKVIAAQVKDVISEFIEQEDKAKPLSDQQLADLLKDKNMAVSRRTVMKYREQLGYPSSAKRRRY